MENLTEVESMCPACQENGTTKLLPHKIRYFRNVLISSFSCPHCGYQNNSTMSLSELQSMGEKICLRVEKREDLDRQVVKSEHACLRVVELDFEIPSETQKGVCSTIEGLLNQAATALKETQAERYKVDEEVARQVEAFTEKLEAYRMGEVLPFNVELDDPSGNSYIENPMAPSPDPQLKIEKYERTSEQLHAMGYYEEQSEGAPIAAEAPAGGAPTDAAIAGGAPTVSPPLGADLPDKLRGSSGAWNLAEDMAFPEEMLESSTASFTVPCSSCGKEGKQKMCEIDIPGFRRCWIMAFSCDFCGERNNEVKPTESYGDKGCRWTLHACTEADLSRDVLKSDTASVSFPELDVSLAYGTLGGVFTTVEGLLNRVADEIDQKFPFYGDSQLPDRKARLEKVVSSLRAMAQGQHLPFQMILDDIADLSHIGRRGDDILFLTGSRPSVHKPDAPDPCLTCERYERTFEQNDELGLNDINVDNY